MPTDGIEALVESIEMVLLLLNIIIGLGVAVPLARHLERSVPNTKGKRYFFVILVVAYIAESVALIVGMGIPVLNLFLAGMWGFLLNRRLAQRMPKRSILSNTLYLSMYSCLPILSFLIVPLFMWLSGGSILEREAGVQFGIPEFMPSFLQTVLGFYLFIYIGAALAKIVIMIGFVVLIPSVRGKTTVS
jgi:hypothetical protein